MKKKKAKELSNEVAEVSRANHTPTPWQIQIDDNPRDPVFMVMDAKFELVHTSRNEALARAIVRAVNSHEALLKQAKLFLEVQHEQGYSSPELEEAIRQAEGD